MWYEWILSIAQKSTDTPHLVKTPNKLKGTTPFQVWKFFILIMALSTWNLKLAICCVLTTSSADIWALLSRKGGMFRLTPRGKMSWIWKPLSTMTESPSLKNCDNTPLHKTMHRGVHLFLYFIRFSFFVAISLSYWDLVSRKMIKTSSFVVSNLFLAM